MAASNHTPLWQSVSRRFPQGKDCLASFLAYETAELLDGVKPANLVNISDRPQPCGRNLFRLWMTHGEELLQTTGLALNILRQTSDNLLLFIYRPDLLKDLVAKPPVQALLRQAGYPQTTETERLLTELESHLGDDAFPHEIGIFLGYPPKDVAAFMGLVHLPFACQGPWKIFGRPDKSLRVAESHRASRSRMIRLLATASSASACLSQSPLPSSTAA